MMVNVFVGLGDTAGPARRLTLLRIDRIAPDKRKPRVSSHVTAPATRAVRVIDSKKRAAVSCDASARSPRIAQSDGIFTPSGNRPA